MKISKYYEYNGVRLEVTLESRDLITHSKMGDLTVGQLDGIRYQLFLAATYTQIQLAHMAKNESIMDRRDS